MADRGASAAAWVWRRWASARLFDDAYLPPATLPRPSACCCCRRRVRSHRPLHEWMERYLLSLAGEDEAAQRAAIVDAWRAPAAPSASIPASRSTGNFRVGASHGLGYARRHRPARRRRTETDAFGYPVTGNPPHRAHTHGSSTRLPSCGLCRDHIRSAVAHQPRPVRRMTRVTSVRGSSNGNGTVSARQVIRRAGQTLILVAW